MKICNFAEGCGGDVNIATFIIAVHSLTAGKDFSHLGLCQILIFSQVSNSMITRQVNTTLFQNKNIIL